MTTGTEFSSVFKVIYEGDDLTENTMSVQDLAPTLQGAEALVQRANQLLNRDGATAVLRMRPPQPGSFEIEFTLAVVQALTTGFANPYITSAVNIQQLLFGGASPGLFGLVKRLRGRSPRRITSSLNDSIIVEADRLAMPGIVEAEGLRVSVPSKVLPLFHSQGVRNAASQFLSPLQRDGIDRMTFMENSDEVEYLVKDDLPSFEVSPQDDNVVVSVIPKQFLRVIYPNLGDGIRRWRLTDGNKVSWYSMQDDVFVDEVRQGYRSFAIGDVLVCEVRNTQRILVGGKITTDLEILTVFEHRSETNGDIHSG